MFSLTQIITGIARCSDKLMSTNSMEAWNTQRRVSPRRCKTIIYPTIFMIFQRFPELLEKIIRILKSNWRKPRGNRGKCRFLDLAHFVSKPLKVSTWDLLHSICHEKNMSGRVSNTHFWEWSYNVFNLHLVEKGCGSSSSLCPRPAPGRSLNTFRKV